MVATSRRKRYDLTHTANCTPDCDVGTFVYITGASVSGKIQVDKIDIFSKPTMPAVGVIVSKASVTDAVVRVAGEFTVPTPVIPGTKYFVGVDAKATSVPEATAPSGGIVLIQYIGTAIDSEKILLSFEQIPIVRTGD